MGKITDILLKKNMLFGQNLKRVNYIFRVNDKILTQALQVLGLCNRSQTLFKQKSGCHTTATKAINYTVWLIVHITCLRFFLISLPTQWYSVSVASKIAIRIRKWSVRPRNKIPSDQMQSSNFCHKPPVRSRRSGTHECVRGVCLFVCVAVR